MPTQKTLKAPAFLTFYFFNNNLCGDKKTEPAENMYKNKQHIFIECFNKIHKKNPTTKIAGMSRYN
jgi:hypothetical protein